MNTPTIADQYLNKATLAAGIFSAFNQKQVDHIVKKVSEAAFNHRVQLAKMAAEETQLGVFEHKIIKNVVATQLVYESIKNEKTVGVLSHNETTGVSEIAQPLGPILAITPVTNPTSTVLFKILICLKSANPIIISSHKRSIKCCQEAARICYEAALEADAPEDCIQFINEPSRDLTHALITNPKLALILATGGSSLVKAAYSSGTPALGVGPGNVPVLIEKTADIPFAVENIITSKTFDNGTICASEQAVVVEKAIAKEVRQEFEHQGCYFLNQEEIKKVQQIAFDPKTNNMTSEIVGQTAQKIAELANISIPKNSKILMAPLEGIGKQYPLSNEILAPILAYYVGDDFNHAVKLSIDLNYLGGLGHTASLYSNDDAKIQQFSLLMNAGRVLVNTPSSQGAVGGIYNNLTPSLTLGCGSGGKNITTENISAKHLINIKKVLRRRMNERLERFPINNYFDENLQWKQLIKLYDKNF
jgi:acetaldehyde dehydrogenase / alcohol dehydrogenase